MTGTVAIIDYGSGNLRSAAKALERAAREGGHDPASIVVTADADLVAKAERVVLPGVGAFADCMAGLKAVPGMIDALDEAVTRHGRPFLGICVGMQLMAIEGLEHGRHAGLGWIHGRVQALAPADPALKVPHMGWNELRFTREHPVLRGLARLGGGHAYFVHSYHMADAPRDEVLAETDYGGPVTAIVGRDNLVGTQFHPEKSQALGLGLLANFLSWRP
jgi:glutamine amidotransferase